VASRWRSARRWKPCGPTQGSQPNSPVQIQALAHILGKNPDQIARLFADKSKGFVYVERLLEPTKAEQAKALKIIGLHSKPAYRRYYPAAK
jgi:cell division protein FtsI (penicillin-binding protein 3)